MRVLKAVCCAAFLAAVLTPGLVADEWNKKTFLTFSGLVQIPGATLPAGTYTFELAAPDTARHVVRVTSKDGTQNYGMFMTVPNDRLDPPSENIIMFAERPAGAPQAIQLWFYPGDRIGEEFVYPKNQAMEIARTSHTAVLSSDDKVTEVSAATSAKVGRVNERGEASESSTRTTSSTSSTTTAQSTPTAPET